MGLSVSLSSASQRQRKEEGGEITIGGTMLVCGALCAVRSSLLRVMCSMLGVLCSMYRVVLSMYCTVICELDGAWYGDFSCT